MRLFSRCHNSGRWRFGSHWPRASRNEKTRFTFVAPNEEADLRAIEQAIGKRLPRVTVPDFDYTARATERRVESAGLNRVEQRFRFQ